MAEGLDSNATVVSTQLLGLVTVGAAGGEVSQDLATSTSQVKNAAFVAAFFQKTNLAMFNFIFIEIVITSKISICA